MITDSLVVRKVSTGDAKEVCDTCEQAVPKGIAYLSATLTIKVGVWPLKKAVDAVIFLCLPCAARLYTLIGKRILEK